MYWFCSDLKVKVVGEQIHAHKFVLAARSDVWSLSNLASTNELDLSGEQLLKGSLNQVLIPISAHSVCWWVIAEYLFWREHFQSPLWGWEVGWFVPAL